MTSTFLNFLAFWGAFSTYLMTSSVGTKGTGPKIIRTRNLGPSVISGENLRLEFVNSYICEGFFVGKWVFILAAMGQYAILILFFYALFFSFFLFFFWSKKNFFFSNFVFYFYLFICLFLIGSDNPPYQSIFCTKTDKMNNKSVVTNNRQKQLFICFYNSFQTVTLIFF